MGLPILNSFLPTLLSSILSLSCGVLAIASNPRRHANILFLTISAHISLWLVTRELAIPLDQSAFKGAAALIAGLIPFHLWLLTTAMLRGKISFKVVVKTGRLWLVMTAILSLFTLLRYFVLPVQTDSNPIIKLHFYSYATALLFLYTALYFHAKNQGSLASGIRGIEINVVTKGGSICAIIILLMTIISYIVKRHINLQPLVISLFYSITVIAITTHRILSTRQLLIFLLTRIASVAALLVLSLTIYIALINNRLQGGLALSASLIIPTSVAIISFNKWVIWFKLAPDSASVISRISELSRTEFRARELEIGFRNILMEWLCTDKILLYWVSRTDDTLLSISQNSIPVQSLTELKWMTSERLLRDNPTTSNQEINRFMENLGLDLVAMSEGATHSLVIGAGKQAGGNPYTYPLVRQIIGAGSIMEICFERSSFIAKIRATEQLTSIGLIGANLAHEIRNPLVSIKTFIQLLERNEIGDLKTRFISEIKDELSRIDRLTKQLIDLSRPREFTITRISLSTFIEQIIELLEPETRGKDIEIEANISNATIEAWSDSEACKQVLINLVRNSIHSLSEHNAKRKIIISLTSYPEHVMIQVGDSGPGISKSIQDRLFQPFNTTKTNGFGLGLAICRDTLAQLGGSISIGVHSELTGAVFNVILPLRRKCERNQINDSNIRSASQVGDTIEIQKRRLSDIFV